MPAARSGDVHALNLGWLVKLRWAAVAGQSLTVVVVSRVVAERLPMAALTLVIGISAASNIGLAVWLARSPRVTEQIVAATIALDVALLTALLYLTGGPYNPFSFLYLVQIALAPLVLPPRLTWALVGLSVACFGALFVGHVPLAAVGSPLPEVAPCCEAAARASEHHDHGGDHGHDMSTHVYGMWVAFGVSASFIVYFLHRVSRSLAARDSELATARELGARSERLASLGTLAGGAAHELATPLASIAIAAKELERRLSSSNEPSATADARLIREEVERCRRILTQMATDAGHATGSAHEPIAVADLVNTVVTDLGAHERVKVDVLRLDRAVLGPANAISQALRGIVRNALESAPAELVCIRAFGDEASCHIEVVDRGPGMPAEVRARAGEPFFTTKEPGQGMGLGLFLARTVVERIGGTLELESEAGRGTTVSLVIPWQTA